MHRGLCISIALMAVAMSVSPAGAQQLGSIAKSSMPAASVPFVGCQSDGQVGPEAAPQGKSRMVHIPVSQAQRLAYYQAKFGMGTLAPRGWYCFSAYGSNGASLFVSPQPIRGSTFFSNGFKGFSGYVIDVASVDGGTSGRFGVAEVIARVFPSHWDFVKKVMAEDVEVGISPSNEYPRGPYPHDKLTYLSNSAVEFVTPANTKGLGTQSWLVPNHQPITGVAILAGEMPDLVQLSMRLPKADRHLSAAILHSVEQEAAKEDR